MGFPLFPRRAKYPGLVLILLGLVLGVARFRFGLKPAMLDARVFAVHAAYLETSTFTMVSNNLAEEATGLLLLAGLLLVALSRERHEGVALSALRARALHFALLFHCLLVALALFLVYGVGFVHIAFASLFSPLVLYIVVMRVLLARQREAGSP